MPRNPHKPPHRNGFSRPLHFQQIMSWVGYLIELLIYIFFIFPSLTPKERIGITIPYIIIIVIYNAVFLRAAAEHHKSPYLTYDEMVEQDGFTCRWCQKYTMGSSKHCRSCNICRLDFDHHCFFLNNCVTYKANYSYFLIGIIFLGISAVFTTFLCIYVIMANEYTNGELTQRCEEWYSSKMPKGLLYFFLSGDLLLMLGIEVFMIYLYALHALLRLRGISTFALIQYRRQKQIERSMR